MRDKKSTTSGKLLAILHLPVSLPLLVEIIPIPPNVTIEVAIELQLFALSSP